VLSLMTLYVDQHLATGEAIGPGHDVLTGRYACYEVYPTRDGKWLAVGAIEPAFWANLCRALGLERWIAHQQDDAVQDAIRADLRAAFLTRDRDAWVAELSPNDTCVAPVQSIDEVVHDAQFGARGSFVDAKHPQRGSVRQVAPALAGMPRGEKIELPAQGASDADALLSRAGYTHEEIARLRANGAAA
jgi:alpha-methylacyl-CoA racemase